MKPDNDYLQHVIVCGIARFLHCNRSLVLAVTSLAVVASAAPAASAQQVTIELRSGQVNGAPGNAGTVGAVGPDAGAPDDNITLLTRPGCCAPLNIVPGDFAAAQTGPPAELIVPHPAPAWIASLPSDPDARWINWNHGTVGPTVGSGQPAQSVLYAIPFDVPCDIVDAQIDFRYAVDDLFGDANLGTPNPEGLYLNGMPLPGSRGGITGNGAAAERQYLASGAGIAAMLIPGATNWLYVYQRDGGGSVSGIIFSATIVLNPNSPVYIGEQLTSNRFSGMPNETLQVVVGYDGNDVNPGLCIQVRNTTSGQVEWLTLGTFPLPVIRPWGIKVATYEFDLNGNEPTGTFYVRDVVPNGVVDGLAFGLFWRDASGSYHMLKSNSDASNGTNHYLGAWPSVISDAAFDAVATQLAPPTNCPDGNCLRQAHATLQGAKLLPNGLHKIGIADMSLPGDFDQDCDVDLQDFSIFAGNFTGPGTGCGVCLPCDSPQ